MQNYCTDLAQIFSVPYVLQKNQRKLKIYQKWLNMREICKFYNF